MIRPMIVGAAVLCLVGAQPASAAWTTSRQGNSTAKAGTVQALVITSCAKGSTTAVRWDSVPGATLYTVMWQQGGGSFNRSDTTTLLTYNVAASIDRVRVQAAVGSWNTSYTEKICS